MLLASTIPKGHKAELFLKKADSQRDDLKKRNRRSSEMQLRLRCDHKRLWRSHKLNEGVVPQDLAGILWHWYRGRVEYERLGTRASALTQQHHVGQLFPAPRLLCEVERICYKLGCYYFRRVFRNTVLFYPISFQSRSDWECIRIPRPRANRHSSPFDILSGSALSKLHTDSMRDRLLQLLFKFSPKIWTSLQQFLEKLYLPAHQRSDYPVVWANKLRITGLLLNIEWQFYNHKSCNDKKHLVH